MSARFRRTLGTAVALAASAVIAGVVQAKAPPGQYFLFDRESKCISDNMTKLTWSRQPSATNLSYDGAASFCASLSAPDGGGAIWRLPSVNELETIVDDVPHGEIEGLDNVLKAIDVEAFPATPVGTPYWTSSVISGNPPSARAVDFRDGTTTTATISNPGDPNPQIEAVRCVTEWVGGAPASCPIQ